LLDPKFRIKPMSSYRTGSSGLSRDLNRTAILRLVGTSGPIARAAIAQRLGLSPATVTSITRELIESGLVRVADRAPSAGGRPALLLELVGGAATAFGAKIAADHLTGVLMDLDAAVIERFEAKLDLEAEGALDRVAGVLADWLGEAQRRAPLLGVGLGVPGVVNAERGTVTAPLIGWRDVPVRDRLQTHLQLPVLVDNDVNTLAISERLYGRGRTAENFLTVTIGRGIGLGIVGGGDIYHGFGGGAGEFGHVTVEADGPRCTCGRKGCLEALVADPALVAQARAAGVIGRSATIETLRKRARGGDADAIAIFDRAGAVFGRAVAGLVNVLSPQLVLISGEGTQGWSLFAASFDRALRSHLFPPFVGVEVEVDPWDDAKWAIGAAALVLRATFTPLVDGRQDELAMRAWLHADQRGREEVVA
jgi:predicted NBD/HSP70 family sugar kinase